MGFEPEATVYTDGACSGNPGPGGWATVIIIDGKEKQLVGGAPSTTNNRCELMAVITALEALRGPHIVNIYSDSEYVVQPFNNGWLRSWKANGWARAGGELKNTDLWQRLDKLAQKHRCTFHWLKGHAGNSYNELCDRLAVEESIRQSQNQSPVQNPAKANAANEAAGQGQANAIDCLQEVLEAASIDKYETAIPCSAYGWCDYCAGEKHNSCAMAYMRMRTQATGKNDTPAENEQTVLF